eukprot:CAMPEP_0182447746 /NCGR_PEP_ID=MMETSP1172-20130603/19614_1 /TAXON_ID=708627 /ORGANISM="Timspurckia oligopyrenoides, Strain CCMP3278" /LENGTH=176 /DNA_ID=CAMNT_0024644297 /DNA_START=215 /DNA_END=742 /DNA_ORIENTATION=+
MKHFQSYGGTEKTPGFLHTQSLSPNLPSFESLVTCPSPGPFDCSFDLIHITKEPVFSTAECYLIIDEAEEIAKQQSWSTKRHGNYATTDLPLTTMPKTLQRFNQKLVDTIYPVLGEQWRYAVPDVRQLRVVDGFVVKYDASTERGQKELKPHRDGSVLSFNIALNSKAEYEGGGTW